MLRVELTEAKPGMALALPVRHPRYVRRVLLRVGYVLTSPTIVRLRELGLRAVWVKYPSLEFLERVLSPEVMAAQGEVVQQISKTFTAVQNQAAAKLSFDSYTRAMRELVENLIGNPQAALFLGDLNEAVRDDLMRHSSTVAYLSVLMGLKLEGYLVRQRRFIDPARAKEVVSLGVGAMLHDIGVTQLSDETRRRYRETGDDTDPAWREHPRLGYKLVRGKVAPSAATVVLNHHQRFDGSGYAGKGATILEGTRIHVFARIAGLAEVFDRLRNPVRLPPQPTVFALGTLLHPKVMARFDPEVMRALLTVVPPYPPGTVLRLSDGSWAVAVDHVPLDPCRPIVQILPGPPGENAADADAPAGPLVNLATSPPELCVARADGTDVAELNFPRPAIMQLEPVNA